MFKYIQINKKYILELKSPDCKLRTWIEHPHAAYEQVKSHMSCINHSISCY